VALRNVIAERLAGAMDLALQTGAFAVTTGWVVVVVAWLLVVDVVVDGAEAGGEVAVQAANVTAMTTIGVMPSLRIVLVPPKDSAT
jgi:hypothetical protein